MKPDAPRIDLQWNLRIPMRDGVRLNATAYFPKTQCVPAPCLFTLTPYLSDPFHDQAEYFAREGLPFLIVDARGRGNSEGAFHPYFQEAQDGYDVAEWLARQPYCSGKVAMWGSSYLGYAQWMTAKGCPPHLATIVPSASPWMGKDFPMRNNIFSPFLVQWLTLTSGRVTQGRCALDVALWSSIYREWHTSGRAFADLDRMIGRPSPVFEEWLSHPALDGYWDAQNPTTEEYAAVAIPVLTITGIYDDDQLGALEHYREHVRAASSVAAAHHYLIIGPWDHSGTASPKPEFGGLRVASAGVLDMPKLHLEWYAWTMQGGKRPTFLKKRVAYYVTGAERWRYADTLEEVTGSYQTFFLDSLGRADDVYLSGSLSDEPGKGEPDAYHYDPRDTSGPEVDALAKISGESLTDQSVVLALRGKSFVYHTAPFDTDTEISGFCRLCAWISIDCSDADFHVSLWEVDLHGCGVLLCTDSIRARYREGLRSPNLIDTEEPLRYEFGRFTFVARQIKRGQRLRLVIAPVAVTGFVERNFNGGGEVSRESFTDARPVLVRLFHDPARPSALLVPLGQTHDL